MLEEPSLFVYLIVALLLVLSALFSGLTLGLMSLSSYELKRKAELGDKDAEKIYPIRKNGNLLLTTLLIGNVAVNSALSIFLGSILNGFVAGLVATGLIVVFGEILPQAIFSKYAMKLGAKSVPLVKVALYLFYPITYPISKILDKLLGEELPTVFSKKELIKIIEEHEDLKESEIDEDEERLMKGVLTFSEKTIKDIMTPKEKVVMFSIEQKIDKEFIEKVKTTGFSRFPIYMKKPDHIVGILHISSLVGVPFDSSLSVSELELLEPIFIQESTNLDEALSKFLSSKRHMFVVKDREEKMVGILTLEDVIEEIIKEEIIDERDAQNGIQAN